MKKIFIGTRGSPLALAQTQLTLEQLKKKNPNNNFELKIIKTTGDVIQEGFLENLKGAFTKELDEALLKREIDMAVHSLKDLPAEIPKGLQLKSITKCIDSRDVLVSNKNRLFKDLPQSSTLGTSSLRRGALVQQKRPDLKIKILRGNVGTRLKKLDSGEYDAIILAAAGLKRLGLEKRITEYLDPFEFIPAVGQGMLAIVCREKDSEIEKLTETINDEESQSIAKAEREFMKRMEGGCQIPLGCYGEIRNGFLELIGFLSTVDSSKKICERVEGPVNQPEKLGEKLSKKMMDLGSQKILEEIKYGKS